MKSFSLLLSTIILFTLQAQASTVEGEYFLQQGTTGCYPKMMVKVECSGLVLSHYSPDMNLPLREDRFCQINQGRQNRQIDTASSLQTVTTQVTSKEVTEILKKEIWHTIVKDEKALNYTHVDHSLVLNPKTQTIVSSLVQTAATPQNQSSNTQVCTYIRERDLPKNRARTAVASETLF